MAAPRLRIGLDVGGTFTDIFMLDEASGEVWLHKLPSTPQQPDLAPLQGIAEILAKARASGGDVAFVGLGTTVATNALLERKGAPTGLLTTAGFRDLLEIARQRRPDTFDLHISKPEPLVPRQLRREAHERIAADGGVLIALDADRLSAEIDALRAAGVTSVAICFLNAYANPVHEQAAAQAIRARWPEADITVSSDVLPEFREYERLTTTIVNAFLMPVMRGYLTRFAMAVERLGVPRKPSVMNSGGGVVTPAVAADRPVDMLFSGPSGGVSGAAYVAARAGIADIITFDMGGTSTDVCVIRGGSAQRSFTREIGGLPIRAAALDVHTVGAGGSSIAGVDAGGLLRVGPHSAGSNPGPACYARGGTLPTVTDANVVLGRLNPKHLLGGALAIDAELAHSAVATHVARPKAMTVLEAATAMLAVANANMAQAVRFVSVERGLDPRDFWLAAFGGAGPVHAAFVARELGAAGVLVPPSPGVLCAMGVLAKDMQMDFSRTRVTRETDAHAVSDAQSVLADLERRAAEAFERNGCDPNDVRMERSADARYVGQNHELSVPIPAGALDEAALAALKAGFDAAHAQLYGYAAPEKPMEIVTFRLRALFSLPRHDLLRGTLPARAGGATPTTYRPVYFDDGAGHIDCPIYARGDLRPDDALRGPCIVEQMDATTVVPPGTHATVDASLNILLRVSA